MLPSLFYTYRPAPPLDRFVDRLWYWEGAPPHAGRDRLMPDGTAGIIINLAEDEVRNYAGERDSIVERFPGAVLVGAHSRYSVIDAREQTAVLGVSFHPGGTWPFFDPSSDELSGLHVGLDDLWGSEGRTLRERVLAKRTPYERLQLLEQELVTHAIRPLTRRVEIDFALMHLSALEDATTIARLSERAGLSARRLNRLFALEVGLSPKRYARIKRFERVFRMMHARTIDWSELAQSCGYFDQSHLIRDCKLISGFTPTDLHARWDGGGKHVRV